ESNVVALGACRRSARTRNMRSIELPDQQNTATKPRRTRRTFFPFEIFVAFVPSWRSLLTSLVASHVVARPGPRVNLSRPRDLLLRIEQHLFPLRDPAGGTRDREEHREKLDRKAHRLIDQARVEVHVGVQLPGDEVLVLESDPLQ